MNKNAIKKTETIISNGGDPLPGCPESWDEAQKWLDAANDELKDMLESYRKKVCADLKTMFDTN